MNHAAPVGGQSGPSCLGVSAGRVSGDNKSSTSTPLPQPCPPPLPAPASPLVLGASPAATKNAANTLRPASAYTGVSCVFEYLREEPKPLPLDSQLFPEALQPGDVVEVWGNTNCGKSMLTLTLITSALLPAAWSGIELGGCNTGVTLIDCDQHFSVFQLVSLMYKRVKARIKLAKDTLNEHKQGKTTDMTLICNIQEATELLRNNRTSLKTKIEEMVQGCLKSLNYIKCMESVQFPIALASMDEHLAKNSSVSLVVVDSLSAFAWYDWIYRASGKFVELKKYYDRVFGVLLASIKKYKVVLVAVKHALFLKTSEEGSRKGQDEQEEEQEVLKERTVLQDDESDTDMEEGDSMENMTESEYFGHSWVSSVTWRVIMSKVRVNSKTRPCVSLQGEAAAGNRGAPHSTSGDVEGREEVFAAEVIRDKQSTKLFFVVGEEGVVWQQVAHVP